MAIAGQGFFAVSQATSEREQHSRRSARSNTIRGAGDFTMNAAGYLVNSAGNYLNGWSVQSERPASPIRMRLMPIQVKPVRL